MERIKANGVFLSILILLVSACSEETREGKWYAVRVEDVNCLFMISSSVYTLPVPKKGFDRLVVGVNWDIKNVSNDNSVFSWEHLYLIDENGKVYYPFYGRIDGGSPNVAPGTKCYGSASIQVPETVTLDCLKCGISGDKMDVQIGLKPQNKTDDLRRRLGISNVN